MGGSKGEDREDGWRYRTRKIPEEAMNEKCGRKMIAENERGREDTKV